MRTALSLACLVSAVIAVNAEASVRRVKSGVVSLTFADEFTDFIATIGAELDKVIAPATPAPGFEYGFPIREDSTFAINVANGELAGFRDGKMNFDGSMDLVIPFFGTLTFMDFAVVSDSRHEPEQFFFEATNAFDGMEVQFNMADFAAASVEYDDDTGRLVLDNIFMGVSNEFGGGGLYPPGSPLARARIELSLAVPNGDVDDDTDVDLDDYDRFVSCVTGPGTTVKMNSCRSFDFDEDSDVDLVDFHHVQARFTDTLFTLDIGAEGETDVTIDVSPADFFGRAAGETPFQRSYIPGQVVSLIAPEATLLSDFVRWRLGNTDMPDDDTELAFTLESPTAVTAVYVSVTSELSIVSTGAEAVTIGVSVDDVFGLNDGITDFTRTFLDSTEVTLTAPATAGDLFFERWVTPAGMQNIAENQTTITIDEDGTAEARFSFIVIHQQPQGISACAGDAFELNVAAVGDDLSYQWQKDGADIPGATQPVLMVEAATPDDAGIYRVSVFNDVASLTSEVVLVTVTGGPPTFVSQPVGADLCPGSTLFMTAQANGADQGFQWFLDGEIVEGANSGFFAITNVQPEDSGVYTVQALNLCGTATSEDAVVDVDPIHCP